MKTIPFFTLTIALPIAAMSGPLDKRPTAM